MITKNRAALFRISVIPAILRLEPSLGTSSTDIPAVDAQCPACGLHELVSVRLCNQRDGTWIQLDQHGLFSRSAKPDEGALEIHLDTCPVCFGAWFDAGELNSLAGELGTIEANLEKPRPSTRVCPHGHGPMAERDLPNMLHTPVERCSTCGGIWLDGNERQRLARGSTSEGQGSVTERVIRRGAIWAAQVLTHLPVEVENPARGTPWVVFLLLLIFVTVFLGQRWDLIWTYFYGLVPGRLWHEQQNFFTLAAYMFMHGSWVHLLFNAYFLYTFGDNIEHLFGHIRFALFFLITGVIAGMIHFLVMHKSAGLVVGASGAISGVLAAYLWAFPRQRLYQVILGIQFKIPVWVYVAGWFAIQTVMGLFGQGEASQVAWFAHIGGFLVGLAGAPLLLALRRRDIARKVKVPARWA